MSEKVFKGVEIVGTSDTSFSHAIEVAVRRARQTLRGLSWFVVEEQRGGLYSGQLEYQVTLRVFFRLEDEAGQGGEGQDSGQGSQDLSEGLERARRAFEVEPTKEEAGEAAQKSSAGESAGRMKARSSKSKKR